MLSPLALRALDVALLPLCEVQDLRLERLLRLLAGLIDLLRDLLVHLLALRDLGGQLRAVVVLRGTPRRR